ncbi:MAG: S41 family peptidase [Defluviitaleaceae bacterium]|nr:S41 family peptidase [Defluviitaleaceae bacterium]
MRLVKLAVAAMALALIIAFSPVTAFANQENPFDDARVIYLTPGARNIALADFDYLVDMILEVAPSQNIIERRFDMTAADFFEFYRRLISAEMPIISILSVIDPENWEAAPTTDLRLAADYIFSVTFALSMELEWLGHFGPQSTETVSEMFFAGSHFLYHIESRTEELLLWLEEWEFTEAEIAHEMKILEAAINFQQLHNAIYHTPAVMQLYGLDPSTFDFSVELREVMGAADTYNVTTSIIEPDRIAYLHIASFRNNLELDSEILFPFYEAIQDFEHLIIDLRGNGGGFANAFPSNVLSMLIDEPIYLSYFEFFIASERTATFFANPPSIAGGWHQRTIPAIQLVKEKGLTAFNPADLALLDYAMIFSIDYFPAETNIPFSGDIWMLVDGESASASETAASIAMASGFATVVGEPTAGVTGVLYTFAALPSTGILFRIDLGYTVDAYGRSIEEFGVIPQILNAPGLDALETVLAIIN